MAKQTLLQIVQSILSDMDADEINSLDDTLEGLQVANVVRETYRSILEEFDLQSTETLFQLDASVDLTKPTHMSVPSNVFDVVLVRYNMTDTVDGSTDPMFTEVPYVSRAEFLNTVSTRNPDGTDYQLVTDDSGTYFVVGKKWHPSMWTSFDGGTTLVFDSYKESVDDTLQTSRTQCLGRAKQDIAISDTATLNIPETLEQLVFNEAREMCFELFKDGAPRKVNEAARISRMKAKERKNKVHTPARLTLPDYGRR